MSYYIDLDGRKILEFSLPQEKLSAILHDLQFPGVKDISDDTFEKKRLVALVSFREF